jgi:hypothetical protein
MFYGLDDRGFKSGLELGIFLLTTASRPTLEPTQPPIQWVPGALFLGSSGRSVNVTTHLHLVPRSKREWNHTSTTPRPSWRSAQLKVQGKVYLYLKLYHPKCIHFHSVLTIKVKLCLCLTKQNAMKTCHVLKHSQPQ